MKHLKTIIGQPLALEQMAGFFNVITGRQGEPIKPLLIHGPSGVGKDYLIEKMLLDLHDTGWKNQLHIRDCDSLALQSNGDTESLVEMIEASQGIKTVIVLNESQKLFRGSKNKTAMERDLCKFIFPHGDTVQAQVAGEIARREVVADFRNLILILATNEKEEMETRASQRKGDSPFARRLNAIELRTYSQDVISEIIPQVFATRGGWKIGETATAMVSRLHRGTMTATMAVCEKLRGVVPADKKTVNRDEIIAACRQTDYLPRGLFKREGKLISIVSTQVMPLGVCQSIIGGGAGLFNASFLHLCNQFATAKDGKTLHTPFIAKVGGGYIATDAGKRYLAAIEKDGFAI